MTGHSKPVGVKVSSMFLAGTLILSPLLSVSAQQAIAGQQLGDSQYRFRVTSDLVLVSVTARDKSGHPVRDLKQSDFTVLEDGKAQHLQSFDVEDVQTTLTQAGPSQVETQGKARKILTQKDLSPENIRDHRLIVLFFDFSAMEVDEVERALDSAQKFIDRQMTPADLVAVVSLSSALSVNQDFTGDKTVLSSVLKRMRGQDATGMEQSNTSDVQEDTGEAFSVDDSEYNIFNTDRRLQAIGQLSEVLGKIDQKKSVLYFSGGVQRTGMENQSQLRAAINAAVRSNVSIYTVDTRGLQAFAPGGSSTTGSLRGNVAYTGRAVEQQYDSNFQSQETLVTLSSDTGGKAFLDSNDFGKAYERVQQDTETYYVLGYRSNNTSMDGKYRRIQVKVNRPDIKLEYRSGYYGPRDFLHFTKEDREQQLQDEIASDLPNTDLPVYMATELFRGSEDKYFVPVSLVVPGSAIPFTPATERDKASLDVIGLVREKNTKFPVGNIRDTVKIALEGTAETRRQNVQYNTGFLLTAGSYHLKFVVRENQNGRMGSFETDIVVPDMKKMPLRMSTVVVASQKAIAPKKKTPNPLVHDGVEIIPNIAHVFKRDQKLYLYYEVYDPAKAKIEGNGKSKGGGVRVISSVQFFRGRVKAYETSPVEAHELNAPERKATAFQLEVPLSELKPGWYTCQVNIIDDAAGTFAFPRLPMLIQQAGEPASRASAPPISAQ